MLTTTFFSRARGHYLRPPLVHPCERARHPACHPIAQLVLPNRLKRARRSPHVGAARTVGNGKQASPTFFASERAYCSY